MLSQLGKHSECGRFGEEGGAGMDGFQMGQGRVWMLSRTGMTVIRLSGHGWAENAAGMRELDGRGRGRAGTLRHHWSLCLILLILVDKVLINTENKVARLTIAAV